MIINCSDPTTVNEDDDLVCVCRDEEGNPPVNLIWYEDGNQIGNTTYGGNILTLTNVTKQHSGRRYTCKARSYTLEGEKSFELIVRPNCKYEVKVKGIILTLPTQARPFSARIVPASHSYFLPVTPELKMMKNLNLI